MENINPDHHTRTRDLARNIHPPNKSPTLLQNLSRNPLENNSSLLFVLFIPWGSAVIKRVEVDKLGKIAVLSKYRLQNRVGFIGLAPSWWLSQVDNENILHSLPLQLLLHGPPMVLSITSRDPYVRGGVQLVRTFEVIHHLADATENLLCAVISNRPFVVNYNGAEFHALFWVHVEGGP